MIKIYNIAIKFSFSNKKYTIRTQTRPTQILKLYFLLKNRVLTDFLRLLVYKFNYLITFWLDLVCNKTLMVRNSTPTHTNFKPLVSYYILNPNKKWYENSICVIKIYNNAIEYIFFHTRYIVKEITRYIYYRKTLAYLIISYTHEILTFNIFLHLKAALSLIK